MDSKSLPKKSYASAVSAKTATAVAFVKPFVVAETKKAANGITAAVAVVKPSEPKVRYGKPYMYKSIAIDELKERKYTFVSVEADYKYIQTLAKEFEKEAIDSSIRTLTCIKEGTERLEKTMYVGDRLNRNFLLDAVIEYLEIVKGEHKDIARTIFHLLHQELHFLHTPKDKHDLMLYCIRMCGSVDHLIGCLLMNHSDIFETVDGKVVDTYNHRAGMLYEASGKCSVATIRHMFAKWGSVCQDSKTAGSTDLCYREIIQREDWNFFQKFNMCSMLREKYKVKLVYNWFGDVCRSPITFEERTCWYAIGLEWNGPYIIEAAATAVGNALSSQRFDDFQWFMDVKNHPGYRFPVYIFDEIFANVPVVHTYTAFDPVTKQRVSKSIPYDAKSKIAVIEAAEKYGWKMPYNIAELAIRGCDIPFINYLEGRGIHAETSSVWKNVRKAERDCSRNYEPTEEMLFELADFYKSVPLLDDMYHELVDNKILLKWFEKTFPKEYSAQKKTYEERLARYK